jgi:hypothetical protein
MLQHRFISRGMAALAVMLVALAALAPLPLAAQAIPFATPAFQTVWQRYDLPVQQLQTARSWTWGPTSIFAGFEPYADTPGGQRQVQYFDKTRMEINNPSNPSQVTNGLLVRELVGGFIATGDAAVQPSVPAAQVVAGDPVEINPVAPLYSSFRNIASLNNDNRAPNRTGQMVNQSIDRSGVIGSQVGGQAVYAYYDNTLGHNVADVFMNFMNQTGTIYVNGQFVQNQLVYDPWVLPMGLPITEPYWTQAIVGGQPRTVLVQLFERRALTYTPTNPVGFQVEMGNVGQHYYAWRYQSPQPPPPPPSPAPVITSGPQRTDLTATTATVEWTTDQPTTDRVLYDTEQNRVPYRYAAGSNNVFQTSHRVTLSGLQPNTVYYWRVASRNQAGQFVQDSPHSFLTPAGTPSNPVTITGGPSATVGGNGTTATIAWTTNVGTTTEVDYGTDPNQLASTVQVPGLVTSHSALLERLTPGTVYYYRVSGSDSAGNFVSSVVLSFQTSGAPVSTPTPTPAPGQPTPTPTPSPTRTPTPTPTPTPPSNAPQITSGPTAAISGNGTIATITWTTNVGTSTIFRYGTAPNQMATQIEQPTATTSHSVMLERLVPNTTYYYQIQACTTAGQCVSTNALPFTTTV